MMWLKDLVLQDLALCPRVDTTDSEARKQEPKQSAQHSCDVWDAFDDLANSQAGNKALSSSEWEIAAYSEEALLGKESDPCSWWQTVGSFSSVIGEWVKCIETIMSLSEAAASWLLKYIANAGPSVVKLYLLECLNKEVRHTFAQILEKALVFCHKLEGSQVDLDVVGACLINLLDQDVADNCWHSSQYFCLLNNYAQLGSKACQHLFKLGAFEKLMAFLLGPLSANMDSEESFSRRWSHTQIHEFGYLHSTLIHLVLACNLTCLHSCEPADAFPQPSDILPMPEVVRKALSGPGASRYLRETQYSMVPSNELKNLSQLLLELLKVDDPLQYSRIKLVIDGSREPREEFDGLLEIIKANHSNDSRRSYQGVKFLVTMAHRCPHAKEYLLQAPPTWQWSVNWLKQTMSEFNTQWSSNASNEDSNTKTFQRTISAQDTLAEATALLTELSSPEAAELGMELDQDEVIEDDDSRLKRTRGVDDMFNCVEVKHE
ncbi:hypothetical protein HPB48_008130 [Haemaphysalis longicornis]|uniref:DUF3517 domain-containing protein n=1 Tax=Haemaphysalis longicornis TaxID=44386 RepID=A0A9J6FV75_HAELO|nr:hypothetical protein HPB48_008130 [Haemaphysalis longicornis]